MKNFYKVFVCGLFAVTLASCGGKEEKIKDSSLPELKASFSSNNFSCNPGEVLSLPYTVTNVNDAVLAFSAKSSDSSVKVAVKSNDNSQGEVEFTAPTFSDGTPIKVTLTVTDPANNRVANAETTVNVTESDPLAVEFASDLKTIAFKPSDSATLPLVISGAGSETVSVDKVTVSSGWSGSCKIASDNKTATLTLTAPASLSNTVSVTVKIKDTKNRTAEVTKDLQVVAVTSTPDAANCYIVAPGQTLTIKGVKGNSAEALTFDNAGLVWQDAKSLVKSVSANGNLGVVVVSLNSGVEGNAVVSAISEGKIVWSWHIWVTNYDPAADSFSWTDAKNVTHTFMDRNIGAMNATKYDAGALGVFFQWGRKDPFVGADGVLSSAAKPMYDIDGNRIYTKSEEHPKYNDHKTTTLEESILNPTTFYYAVSSDWPVVDWLTNDASLQDNDLWGGVSGYKTKYDPCPKGWRVPASGDPWGFRKEYKKEGQLNDSGKYDSSYAWFIEYDDAYSLGFRYKTAAGKEFWFPFAGKIDCNTGVISGVGGGAQFHTSTVSNTLAVMEMLAWGNPSSETGLNRPYGASVRCVKE